MPCPSAFFARKEVLAVLAFTNMTIQGGSATLLDGASGMVRPGEVLGLIAPNGMGKTTLMRALVGAPDVMWRGTVLADDVPISQEEEYRRLVFYVPGDASLLYPLVTVHEQLHLACRCWKANEKIEDAAKRCRIDGFLYKRIHSLSLGMKQQVALAVGYLTGARYLLLDEPMNALDPTNLKLNSEIIRELCDEGTGVLMSSHILPNVEDLADEVVFIRDRSLSVLPANHPGLIDTYDQLYG